VVKKWAAIVRLPLAILNPLARFGGIFLQYRSFPRAKYVPHSKDAMANPQGPDAYLQSMAAFALQGFYVTPNPYAISKKSSRH
jgi:hypothetical protein